MLIGWVMGRSVLHPARLHLRPLCTLCPLLRYVYYLDFGLSLVAVSFARSDGSVHSYWKRVVFNGWACFLNKQTEDKSEKDALEGSIWIVQRTFANNPTTGGVGSRHIL